MMETKFDLATLTDKELCDFHKAWEKEAKRRSAIRKRQALMNFREALGEFLKEGLQYDFDKYIKLDVINDCGDEDIIEINVFDETIFINMKTFLDTEVGNYTGE